MKRVTIITFIAVLLCVLPACGGAAVSSTGGVSNITDSHHGKQRDELMETEEDMAEAAQEASIDIAGTDKPAFSAASNAESGSVPFEVSAAEIDWFLAFGSIPE